MKTSVKERIKQFIAFEKISQKEFEKRIGASNGYVNSISKSIGANYMVAINREFPNLNETWLLTGEGEMLKNGETISETVDIPGKHNMKVCMVPLIPTEALAGSLVGVSESVDIANCRKIPCPMPEAELAIPVTGDSMMPEICSGTVLYIKRINERAFIPWGHTLVVDTENGVVVKKIYPSDDDGYIKAVSNNSAYPPFDIDKASVYGIYRVLGHSFFNSTI